MTAAAGRVLEAVPGTPVLLASGYTGRTSLREAIREKGYSFLQKPCGVTALLEAVREALEG